MVEGKLLVVNPPSGRVPGRGLLALPILKVRRQWNRGEIAKMGSVFGGFATRRINRQRGAAREAPGVQAPPWRGQALGRARWPSGSLVVAPRPTFGVPKGSGAMIFYPIFPNFWSTFNMGETWNKKKHKTETGTRVH